MATPRGNVFGHQTKPGTPLGEQFPYGDAPDQERAYHGSPVAGIDEVKPGSEVGWANHEASHPNKVYAAVGDEEEGWRQGRMAASRKLSEYMAEHGSMPPIEQSPTPTVYDVTMRGNVTTDPEYEANPFAPNAIRADRATVNRELPMPEGAQGTLLPDYYGRTSSFAEGFRDTLLSEDTGDLVTGQRYEKPDSPTPPNLTGSAIAYNRMNEEPRDQMAVRSLDVQRKANYPSEYRGIRSTPPRTDPGPQLFSYDDVADDSSSFPYGRMGGWESRRQAFRDADMDRPIRW